MRREYNRQRTLQIQYLARKSYNAKRPSTGALGTDLGEPGVVRFYEES
jgi:hypothetical protein